MARKSKWSPEDRKKLLKMVGDGVSEQEIREKLAYKNKAMTSVEFAQQLKMAMVESGKIKQETAPAKQAAKPEVYKVTSTGRLTVTDFSDKTGAKAGSKFSLEKPRGRSNAWRLVPVD
ncbi:MAG: hypothetical protein KQH53_18295 [Desulfarculaceae bacterium]|nr:hypothetical protein [Desulfarculaceae bacterium]